ncbi:hypothetical protein [Gemmatimonas sp.]
MSALSRSLTRSLRRLQPMHCAAVLAAAFHLPVARLSAQAGCVASPTVVCSPKLESAVAEFRISQSVGTYTAVMQLRFVNRSAAPLTLGYVDGSGQLVDDQGNRWTVFGSQGVRGIGRIGSAINASFELQPGEAGEASFELRFMGGAGAIRGTRFTPTLAIREIEKLASGQVRLGREYVLRFGAVSDGMTTTAPAAAPTPTSSAMPADPGSAGTPEVPVAVSGAEAACTGRSRCQAAGPIMAEIIRVVGTGAAGRGHSMQIGVRFRNVSTQPLIIGYRAASVRASDENGAAYRRDGANEVRGIGVISRSGADPQFALAPGASREAVFGVTRYWKPGTALGTRFAFDIAVAELQVLPGRQISVGREHALAWTDLTLGAGGADVQKGVDALKSIFKKKGTP